MEKETMKKGDPHYKFGKQKGIMPLATFEAAMKDAINRAESLEALAYSTLLWHTGVRKSEAYERPLTDVTVTEDLVTVDFHKRKKGGDEVTPLKIPRSFYGVEEFLVPWIAEAEKIKPKKRMLYNQVVTEETRTTLKGKVVTVKKRTATTIKDHWLFPGIASTKAWQVTKRVLGEKFYPHYFRLRKLSAIGSNPETASIIHIKSVSGLRSLRAIESYLGTSEKTQDAAM